MFSDDLVYKTTLAAARRLLKIRLRIHLSQSKVKEGLDSWKSLVQLEEAFQEDAETSWANVTACWRGRFTDPVTQAFFNQALSQAWLEAREDVESSFIRQDIDPVWVRSRMSEYRAPC